jgi:hypothetical protein
MGSIRIGLHYTLLCRLSQSPFPRSISLELLRFVNFLVQPHQALALAAIFPAPMGTKFLMLGLT